MARLEISLDTDTDEMSVTLDGEALDNVDSVSVYAYMVDRDTREPHFELVQSESNGSFRTCTRICAAEAAEKYAGESAPLPKVAGYVKVGELDEVQQFLASRLQMGRRRPR